MDRRTFLLTVAGLPLVRRDSTRRPSMRLAEANSCRPYPLLLVRNGYPLCREGIYKEVDEPCVRWRRVSVAEIRKGDRFWEYGAFNIWKADADPVWHERERNWTVLCHLDGHMGSRG